MRRGAQVILEYETLGEDCSMYSPVPTGVPAGAVRHPSHIRKISLSGSFWFLENGIGTKIAKNNV